MIKKNNKETLNTCKRHVWAHNNLMTTALEVTTALYAINGSTASLVNTV
jgi:hypothetical protein